jgi:hypothetical protein
LRPSDFRSVVRRQSRFIYSAIGSLQTPVQHDLTSAVLVWYMLALSAWLLKPEAARAIDFAPEAVQQP